MRSTSTSKDPWLFSNDYNKQKLHFMRRIFVHSLKTQKIRTTKQSQPPLTNKTDISVLFVFPLQKYLEASHLRKGRLFLFSSAPRLQHSVEVQLEQPQLLRLPRLQALQFCPQGATAHKHTHSYKERVINRGPTERRTHTINNLYYKRAKQEFENRQAWHTINNISLFLHRFHGSVFPSPFITLFPVSPGPPNFEMPKSRKSQHYVHLVHYRRESTVRFKKPLAPGNQSNNFHSSYSHDIRNRRNEN